MLGARSMAVTVAPRARQRFGEQSAAAAHVENARRSSVQRSCDVARTHGIELVQRFEFAIDIPEAMRGGFEFRDFRGVAVLRIVGRFDWGLVMRAEV